MIPTGTYGPEAHWVTGDIYIRHSRVPLPEIYSSLSEVFHKAYADETEVPGVEAVSALGGVEVCWIAVLPDPGNLGSWLGFERNSRGATTPDARIGDDIHGPMERSGSRKFP